MTPEATVDISTHDAVPVASLSGAIDLWSSEAIREEIARAIGESPACAVVDLSDVAFIDSSGLRLLFGLRRRFARQRIAIVLPHDEKPREIFDMVDAADVLDLFDSLDVAVAYCRG